MFKLIKLIKHSVMCVIVNRGLITSLAKRDVMVRHQGSIFGLLWSLITPMIMLAIYTFVFSVIFKARWGGGDDKYYFAMLLFSGLIVFNYFSDVITRSPNLIISHSNYVTKVIFPIEILPWVITISALVNFILSFFVWLVFYMVLIGFPPVTIILLPVIIIPFIFMCNGFSFILSSIGVYLRDLNQITLLIVSALVFLAPIFYPISSVPNEYQKYLYLNPITSVIEQLRSISIYGKLPSLKPYLFYLTFSMMVYWLGFFWFQKTKKGFGDVL